MKYPSLTRPDHRPTASRGITVLLLAAALAALPAVGQQVATFEFNSSNPGARSLGFGGAFAALADDATAVFANPAGLVQLVEPEVSIEGRLWSFSTPFARTGRVAGQPTGIGIDTEPGLRRDRSEAEFAGLSFLSFVYPRKRWSLALYRHQLANFESVIENRGIFGDGPPGLAGERRIGDSVGEVDLEIVAHGFAAALRVNDDLSIGLGISYFDGYQRIFQDIYRFDADTEEAFFAEGSFLPERKVLDSTRIVDDHDWGFTAGFLWRLGERSRLGGFFRQGAEFVEQTVIRGGPFASRAFPGLAPGAVVERSAPSRFPDVYGLGIARRSRGDRLTVSVEWDRVEYSTLIPGNPNTFIEDGDELRLGAEVAFLGATPFLALRLGAWLDPNHRLRSRLDNPASRALLGPGDDEIHLAVGLGARFDRVQIDLAADFSDVRDTVSVSTIYNF